MTRQADLKRRVRARMARTGESYAAVRAQLLAARDRPDRDRLAGSLHVTNGDVTVDLLRRAGLARDALAWADVLHEGPVPAGLGAAGLRRVRAEFIAGADGLDPAAVRRRFEERDRVLAANRGGRYVLWFEADLYDQLQIAQILGALGDLGVAPGRVTLVCIGEYPGIAHFGGLGELEPGQFPGLLDAATPLTAEALDLGAAAWAALRAADPAGLGPIAASRSRELRFLGQAFDRLSREYPSTRDGLSLTERRLLAATPDGPEGSGEPRGGAPVGGASAGAVFARLGEREARPFLGDLFFFRIVARLATGRVPLLRLDPPGGQVTAGTGLRPTAAGRRVLRGEADHVALNGIDRWVGGVHLHGGTARWRWDEGTESIAAVA
jgi:hypothetical protein